MSVLISIIAFAAVISILVSFHEFGHYWVAKRLGVKVLRFSVGFGKPLWKRIAGADRTEYVLAAIPLGGYVKMLDEREGRVDAAEVHRAFNRQPVAARIAIVAAGPLFNFLLAIAAYWLMFILGVAGMRPVIGAIAPDSVAAHAGLARGAEIVAVDEDPTPTWESATIAIIDQALDEGEVRLTVRDRGGETNQHVLDLHSDKQVLGETSVLESLGIRPWAPKIEAVIGDITDDSAAERAGLRSGDRIVSANGQAIADWQAWVAYVRARPDADIRLKIKRGGRTMTLALHTDAETEGGERVGRIGAYPHIDRAQFEAMQVEVRYNPLAAFVKAVDNTWDFSILTLRILWRLVTGEASLKNVSGPITIAQFAGVSALIGLSAFLGSLAVFSISIGILNLLPVPVLDGGHLMYYLIELVKGSPVSEQVEAVGQRIGLAMLAGLMALAFYNDIARLFG
jgi:regulator of sigma E protease